MLKTPFFSIIIPTLNEEAYLPELLKDLTKQIYQNFDVVVVDGHSEDKTQEIAQEFTTKLPKLTIINSTKRNLPYQRNLGAKNSQGDYLVFLDADVSVPINYLEKIHQALLKKKVDYLTTWVEADEKTMKHGFIMNMTNLLIEVSKFIDKPFVCGGNAIFSKKSFMQVGGFNEDIKMHEDYDLSVRLNQAGFKLYVLRKPKMTISMRRYREQGTKNTLKKYALYTAHFFLKGAPTTDIFKYEMGGQVYNRKTKK
jgi:glycosyltransferase involved in cell wall biosynthesis